MDRNEFKRIAAPVIAHIKENENVMGEDAKKLTAIVSTRSNPKAPWDAKRKSEKLAIIHAIENRHHANRGMKEALMIAGEAVEDEDGKMTREETSEYIIRQLHGLPPEIKACPQCGTILPADEVNA